MTTRRMLGPVAALALVGTQLATSGQANAQAPQPGDFFIGGGNDIYNIAGGGDFTSAAPWAENIPISAPRLEGICIGPTGYVFVSEQGGNVFVIQQGGDQSSLTPFVWFNAALGGMWCSSTEVYVTAPLDSLVYDASNGTTFVTGATGIIQIDKDSSGRFLGIGSMGDYWEITGGILTSLGSDMSAEPYYGFAVNNGTQSLASRFSTGEVVDVTAGGSLATAPVFAQLPGGAAALHYVEGLGIFAYDHVSYEVFDISAGGTFTAGNGFAQLPADTALLGMAYVHGCGDGVVWTSGGEQCDDGNTSSGDGCSDTCATEGAGGSGGSGGTGTGGTGTGGTGTGGTGTGGTGTGGTSGTGTGGTGGAGTGGTAGAGTGGSPASGDDDSKDEGGCGCRAVGSSNSLGGYGIVALGLLGLVGLGRRRQQPTSRWLR